MRIGETGIEGVLTVDIDRIEDDRGYFARSFSRYEFDDRDISLDFVQANVGFSKTKFTLRGIHHQVDPHAEFKLVRCTTGEVFDVAVDLRTNSPTYLSWFATELSRENRRSLLIPPGCGHGYLTTEPETELEYWTTHRYAPDAADGVRFDDPAIAIDWPAGPVVISTADRSWPMIGANGTGDKS